MVLRWLRRLFRRSGAQESLNTDGAEAGSDGIDDSLERQAELAEAVKAKTAFAAMLTDDANDRALYEELRNEALQIMGAIRDKFYTDFARLQIIRLYVAAGETDRASALLVEVEDEFLLDEIHDEFPDLEPASSRRR